MRRAVAGPPNRAIRFMVVPSLLGWAAVICQCGVVVLSADRGGDWSPHWFGGPGPDREALADLAAIEGGFPPPPVGGQNDDDPGGLWVPIISQHWLRGPTIDGWRHPGTSAVAIYRHLVADIRERAADDRGWGLFLLRATGPHPIADGSLADMVVLGEDVALWA